MLIRSGYHRVGYKVVTYGVSEGGIYQKRPLWFSKRIAAVNYSTMTAWTEDREMGQLLENLGYEVTLE